MKPSLLAKTCLFAIAASVAAAPADENSAIAIPAELMDDLFGTTVSVGLRVGVGFKDNVLLTETGKIESPFVSAEVDAFVWRPPEALTDFYWAITGAETHFLDAPDDANHERVWMTQGELRYAIGTFFKTGLMIQGYHMDQVLDLSTSEIGTFRARLKVYGVTAGPNLRWEFRGPWWLEAAAAWKLEKYKGAEEDYDEPGVVARVGRKLGKRHDLSAAWLWRRKGYHDRNAYTVGGRPLPDTTLSTHWNQAELRFVSKWSASWSTTLKVAGDTLRDSASGYFDYDHWRADIDLAWRLDPWKLRLTASHGAHEFLIQIAGTGFTPPPREIRQTRGALAVERSLTEKLSLFAEVEVERSRTNEFGGSYRLNTGTAGLAYEF
ncbi:MAG TPA: hypothetical protein VMM36_01595 [Opitutaceae bacterium]|nr:hypothetical protein [Opitutaceae bacterium]